MLGRRTHLTTRILEEPASGCVRDWSSSVLRPCGAVNLQPDAIEILKVDPARCHSFTVWHNTFVLELYVKLAELVLVRYDLFHSLCLEGEVMKPGLALSKAAIALLPQG